MKAVLLLALLAVAFALTIAAPVDCDIDGEGVPDCTADSAQGVKYRDNWDPVHYWVCENGAPVMKSCSLSFLFDATTRECVDEAAWNWSPVCPE